ncbi:MAG TPA: tyrosine-type recombinase/integrase [Pseudolabrys sp.]|nr:tyrosine-type recombinase/integrase [Pseudolabrys sp.]
MRIRLKFVSSDIDRYGNVRYYVRLTDRPKVRLLGVPGSDDFMREYHAAIAATSTAPRQARTMARGSFGYLCRIYYASATFKALDKSTRDWRRRALDEICAAHADKPVAALQSRHIRKLRDEKAETPGAANIRVKALRALFRWAVEADEAEVDPARDVRLIHYATQGFHSWSLEEVAAFEQRHPIGSKARLALAILLYTACRREDAVRFGPQHLRDGRIRYTQGKNEHRAPVSLDIPAHPDLVTAIAAMPSGHLTFLVTEYGRPFTPAGFGNWFRDRCNEAGLSNCTAHGLRKATAARLAERGATAHEIMSITGHKTLAEVERYTRAAAGAKLADSAMAKLRKSET